MNKRKLWGSIIALFYAVFKIFILLIASGYLAKLLLLNMINLISWIVNKEINLSVSYLNDFDINIVSAIVIIFFTILIAYIVQRLIPDPIENYLKRNLVEGD